LKKNAFTKGLTLVGTVLTWLPILAPIFFSLALLASRPIFRIDYLMPLELFPLAIAGGALLVWASLRARDTVRLICWSIGVAVAALLGSQLYAVLSGLASGETEAAGWIWFIALALILVYILAVIAAGVGGILLSINLFKAAPELEKTS
jgi:hypothetical protein